MLNTKFKLLQEESQDNSRTYGLNHAEHSESEKQFGTWLRGHHSDDLMLGYLLGQISGHGYNENDLLKLTITRRPKDSESDGFTAVKGWFKSG